MRGSVAIFLVLALTGCGLLPRREAPVGDPLPICFIPCTPSLTDTGFRWTSNPEDPKAWDELGNEVLPGLSKQSLTCEERRQACADFIESLRKRGVYRGSKP